MIDSHCHLDDPRLDGCRAEVLARACKAGVDRFIVAGTGTEEWPRLQMLCKQQAGIHAAYGIHPWFCNRHQPQHLEQLATLLDDAVALGECGLDATQGKPDAATQIWWLREQLALAKEHELPVILHCVRSSFPLLTELRRFPTLRGVVHGFTGSPEEARQFTELGFHIGIGALVLRQQAKKVQRLAAELPLAHLMLETDAPDGLPGELNEPANLPRIAESVAALREVPLATIIAASDTNATELFRL